MTNTDTADAIGTAIQVKELARAGSEIVRITVNNAEAAAAVGRADNVAAAFVAASPTLAQRVNGGASGDTRFRTLFSAWRNMDGPAAQPLAIPSRKPVDAMSLTSMFGVRNDPFNGRRCRGTHFRRRRL